MNNRKSAIPNLVSPLELSQRSNRNQLLSSRQLNWNDILVEHCQYAPSTDEAKSPAQSQHRLILPLCPTGPLIQKRDNRLHESILQEVDSIFIPAGYPGSWRCPTKNLDRPPEKLLHIWLKPESIKKATEAAEIDIDRLDLINNFGQQDSQLYHIAMLLLAELQSDGIMGRLYVESLTQVLLIHLLRHYSTFTQPITFENRSLSDSRLQQEIDYIHAHLERDLSLVEIAQVINISPTYFASLFKRDTGISPHKYVLQQRVERAKLLLSKTDLAIANIALEVGFSNQSHLTRHFKRFTKDMPVNELAQSIRLVYRGYSQMGPGLMEKMVDGMVDRKSDTETEKPELAKLTPRELEVAKLKYKLTILFLYDNHLLRFRSWLLKVVLL